MAGQDVLAAPSALAAPPVLGTLDVSDRPARQLGVIYGSRGQVILQTASAGAPLQVEESFGGTLIDPRSIRALTTADAITATLAAGGSVDVTDRAGRLLGQVSVPAGVDVTDRAARLVGIVFGTLAQLKQSGSAGNPLQVELQTGASLYDARAIRAITSSSDSIIAYGSAPAPLTQVADALSGLAVALEIGGATYDARQIRALTTADAITATLAAGGSVDVTDRAGRLLGHISGDVAAGVADSGNPVKIGGLATTAPTTVTTGQRTPAWFGLRGNLIVGGIGASGTDGIPNEIIYPSAESAVNGAWAEVPHLWNGATLDRWSSIGVIGLKTGVPRVGHGRLTTYGAVFRLAARPYYLSHVFAGAGRFQYGTIFHGAGSTKTVRLVRVAIYLASTTAGANLAFDLSRLTAATTPATGNPAITPQAAITSAAAAEVTCLALPTVQGTELLATGPFATADYTVGISAAASTVSPPPGLVELVLWPPPGGLEWDAPTLRAGVAEGWGIVVDTTAAATVLGELKVYLTEE